MRAARTFIASTACGLLLLGCAGGAQGSGGSSRSVAAPASPTPAIEPSEPFEDVVAVELTGPEDQRAGLHAWVADTPDRRRLGLMHRTELPEDAGMLFVFAEDHSGGFWMKNTLIPLSIAYIAADGAILAILDMQPCEEDPCPVYDPGTPYRFALEANEGWFDRHGVDTTWRLQR